MSRRLENLIASVAPGWAAARAANRLRLNFSEQKAEAIAEMLAMAAHDSAEYSRVTADWNTRLLSSDQAVIADQPTAIARSRDAIRNDGTAGSIVDAHVRHTVGIGITPRANARHPRTGVQLLEFNRAADRVWYQWARDKNLCHTERHWNFTGLESLTVREEVTTGVSFAIFNYTPRVNDIGTHIQIVEFEQLVAWLVKNPDTGFWIRNGVEIDDFGAPAALWVFTKGHPLEYIQGRMAYTRVPWDRVLCSMRPERVRQSQGMGRLSPVLQPLHHNKLYELYSVLRAKIECIAGASIESDHDALPPGPGQDLFGGAGTNGPGGPYTREKDISLQPGMIVPLAPGRTMKFHTPTTPGSQYEPFTRTQITKVAAGAGLDYPTVARDFTGMTYSGQLQGRLETWAETDPSQLRLVDDFCRPIRDKVITMAILEGRLEAPGFDNPEWRAAYLEAEWRGPKKGSINPANDRAADKIALDYKLTTRRDILNEENLDVREVVTQLSDEYRMGQEQDPPVEFPDAQPKPTVSPNEPRPGAQDDRQKKGLALAANVGELLDRIEKLEQANVALAAGWDESKHPRVPAGQKGGGEFGEGGKGATEKSKEAHGAGAKPTKESAGGDAGHVEALPLPPKDAPEELKNLYRERQREYTRSKTAGTEEEKKKHLDRVAELKTQIDQARKDHPDWFARKPGERKPPADAPGAPPANAPGAKTAKGLKQQFKEHQGVSLRFMHLDHEVDPDERPQDFVNKTYFEMADRVDGALTATRTQFGNDFKLRCERAPLRKLEISDAGTLVYRGRDGRQHSDAVGLHDPSSNHITVAAAYLEHRQYDSPRVGRWVVDDTFEGTVRHEFGHYVQNHLLSNKELTLWMQKFKDVDSGPTSSRNAIAKHISKYAATSGKECFAESFCAYTHPGYRRGMLPPEFEDFFDNLVFEKTEKQIGESRAMLDSPWRK